MDLLSLLLFVLFFALVVCFAFYKFGRRIINWAFDKIYSGRYKPAATTDWTWEQKEEEWLEMNSPTLSLETAGRLPL